MIDGGFATGRTLGRYELLVPIADGGMASVWAARMKGQRGFQKIVAIKHMRHELMGDDSNFEVMFLDEASLVSRLRHPNIAEILDLGEEGDELFQVMEYVDGEPLNRLIRQAKGGIPAALAVRIVKEACAGLHAAHELRDEEGKLVNLVHRDVSLQNILVTYDGNTKVIDFGVAKALSNLQKTNVGQVKGKVPYMSPEQAVGDVVDRRSDVFALGIVFFQLLTGKHPFRGDSDLETIMRICEKKPAAPPSSMFPGIPPGIDAVVVKALAKDKNARFPSMDEMQRALETALPGKDQASSEDLARFMQQHLGARGEKRKLAIQDAGRALDQLASDRRSTMPPSPIGGPRSVSTPPPPMIHEMPGSGRPLSFPPPPRTPFVGAGDGGPLSAPLSQSTPPPRSRTVQTIPPPPATDRTASGLQLPPPPSGKALDVAARAPRGGGAVRTAVLGLLAGCAGLVVGYAGLMAAEDGGGVVPIAVPALSKAAAQVKARVPAAAAPAITPQDAGPEGGASKKKK